MPTCETNKTSLLKRHYVKYPSYKKDIAEALTFKVKKRFFKNSITKEQQNSHKQENKGNQQTKLGEENIKDILARENISEEYYNERKTFLYKNCPQEYQYLINYVIISLIKYCNGENPNDLESRFKVDLRKCVAQNLEVINNLVSLNTSDCYKLGRILLCQETKDNINYLGKLGIIFTTLDDFLQNEDLLIWDLKTNIQTLEEIGIKSSDELLKLKDIITSRYSQTIKENIQTFTSHGIKSVDELLILKDILPIYNTYDIRENIETLTSIGIKSAYELLTLKDIITSYNTNDIRENIKTLKDCGIISAAELLKLKDIITSYDTTYIRENIETFTSHGIKSADELLKLKDIITSYNTGNIRENIKTLTNLGIKSADELLILKDIISSPAYETNIISQNIETLKDCGIISAAELLTLKDIITSYKTEEIRENIKTLTNLGIKSADELLKLKDIICHGKKGNLQALIENGIKSVDEFLTLKDIIALYNKPEEIRENIKTLKDCGIISAAELLTLKDIITSLYSPEKIRENIETLTSLGIKSVDDFLTLKDIICCGNKKILEALIKNGIKSADELSQLSEIINRYSREDTGEIIKTLANFGIKSTDDLLKLQNIIRYGRKENLQTLIENGINSTDDLLKLQDIVTLSSTKGIGENIEILSSIGIKSADELLKLKDIITSSNKEKIRENIETLSSIGIKSADVLSKLQNIICNGRKKNLKTLIENGINSADNLLNLQDIITSYDTKAIKKNIETLTTHGINSANEFLTLKDIITSWDSPEKIRENIETLTSIGIKSADEFLTLKDIICCGSPENLRQLTAHQITSKDALIRLSDIILNGNPTNLQNILEVGITSEDTLIQISDIIQLWDPKILQKFIKLQPHSPETMIKLNDIILNGNPEIFDQLINLGIISEDTRIKLRDIIQNGNPKTLERFIEHGIKSEDALIKLSNIIQNGHPEILKPLLNLGITSEDKVIKLNKSIANGDLMSLTNEGFSNEKIINTFMEIWFPTLDIQYNETEATTIFEFFNSLGGISKSYTILTLITEKMIQNKIEIKEFKNTLLKKIANYQKVLDMYPEHKIPEGLKISIGLEIEMTEAYKKWYQEEKGVSYKAQAEKISKIANIGAGADGVHEFAPAPSKNPMVTLLEIYLLQDLELLDLNDMAKGAGKGTDESNKSNKYNSRIGSGYHLNIGSDGDVKIDDNIHFIQNLCTILPRGGILNGSNVNNLNRADSNLRENTGDPVFSDNDNPVTRLEFRTYSIDCVELFEKNILFNTYAVMGSQAQKKVLNITSEDVMKLKDNTSINTTDDLMNNFENEGKFKENQDIKSKKIAIASLFMQICVLRAIDDYNHNFIDNELFGEDLIKNLSKPWKSYLIDLCFSGLQETIGGDSGISYIAVKKYATNLYKSFEVEKYLQKSEPFNDEETESLLKTSGDRVEQKRIPYVTKWVNKRLLWAHLCEGCTDTAELENSINEKISTMGRIKSSLRLTDPNSNIDSEYLYNYFREHLSLESFNPYQEINTNLVNRMINLNNFFLKNDNVNAKGILQNTKYNGIVENYIYGFFKFSIFELEGEMRKGYNSYQGGSENMLIHKSQKIALEYMETVKNILFSDE